MRKFLFVFVALFAISLFSVKSYAQGLDDEQYNYVTMDLRGILTLTMTTNPQVDFVFSTIQEYQNGITRFNAVQLEVDATMNWDLFVYASEDNWTVVDEYSTTGHNVLPAEILEMKSSVPNAGTDQNFDDFAPLKGLENAGIVDGEPTEDVTQFLAGAVGSEDDEFEGPGTAAANPDTHRFRIDMKLQPEIPATFETTLAKTDDVDQIGDGVDDDDFAMAGYYYIEVVYTLVEDL